MRNLIDIIETAQERPSAEELFSTHYVSRGIKFPKSARIWRGESEESGNGTASYGRGLYTTLDRNLAKQYGSVVEYRRDDLPWNGLRFKTINDFQIWYQQTYRALGYDSPLEVTKDFDGLEKFIHSIDDQIDGLQIGTGKESIFVSFPNHERYRK